MTTYKTYLRSVGRKPLPPHDKMRSTRLASDLVLLPVTRSGRGALSTLRSAAHV